MLSQTLQPVRRSVILVVAMWLCACVANAQQPSSGTVRGKVVDPSGALVSGASVTIISADGTPRTVVTNHEGAFVLDNLAAGQYLMRADAPGFASYENPEVEVLGEQTTSLEIALDVTIAEAITVGSESPVNTDPAANASATVLRESEIEALPSDAAELAAALQALAGPAAGPNGGAVFIDGFSGGRMPPRDAIREIRINQNPFSSEYDRLGLGRIEILTKPGTDDWHGEVEGEFEDESLNSRNPFAANRPPFQMRDLSGNLSGPLVSKRASFFVDVERENIDNNALINALVLDQNFNVTPFRLAVLAPDKELEFSPRVDAQLNEHHTLVGRYSFARSSTNNAGLGGFDLLSRAFATRDREHTFRLTETAIISASMINEARFQYLRRHTSQAGDDQTPTIRVLEAFTSGGANVGQAFTKADSFELQNHTSWLRGPHTLKIGGRLRHFRLTDSSPGNFAGTFTFLSLDQYRQTLLNTPGAFPTQFSIAGGNPQAAVKQTDVGLFVQDDWRINPELTLSFGLRYENQTNISSHRNFAPRVGFAYAPGAGGNSKPKTVLRGGFGMFYDRFGESLTLEALRFNGLNQQQFVVTDPALLDAVVFTPDGGLANVPTISSLTAFAQRQTTRLVAPDVQAPYTMQTALGIERQLPAKTTLSVTYVNARTRHLLRSRSVGNVFQYESTGRFNQHQLIFNLRSNFSQRVSLFANYAFGRAQSDTDGAGTFPADSDDLSGEYGRSLLDIRHRLVIGGNYRAPLGLRFSPFITFRSGVPFNITTGTDTNDDTLFTERPAFATSLSEPGIIVTRFGAFDPTAEAGDTIIPRNYGRGPGFFVVNLRAAKEFGFGGGHQKSSATPGPSGGGGGGNRGGINSPYGGGGGPRGGDDDDESPYKLEFSVQIRNLFNHTNGGTPVGNLRSSFFGDPVSLAGGFGFGGGGSQAAGNRRIRFEVQFSF